MSDSFKNEALINFAEEFHRRRLTAALMEVRNQAAEHTVHWPIIDGEALRTEMTMISVDPSHPTFVVGRFGCASMGDTDRAVAAARDAFPAWAATTSLERCGLLKRLAERLRARRFELTAWIILEVGKPWHEADADVAEAIDFCEFYAREMRTLDQNPRRRNVPGEENCVVYQPLGVAAVIAPWNFPLAILTGMTTAALVTGNTVVVKPAEQSTIVAAKFFEALEESGLPPGVANFLPGTGEEVGARLVEHPGVDLIAFTGSRAVGLQILESAAQTNSHRGNIKRVIAEMGGKNAIIIDEDADLDGAVKGVAASAFGYAGQKCSACSRVIVLDSIHDLFLKRLVETVRGMNIGLAADPETLIGPLIDEEARRRVLTYMGEGCKDSRLVCEVGHQDGGGFFLGPAIFDRVPPRSVIAQEEIFGPVLAVINAETFDQALQIANDTDYALTGGVYSRSSEHIEQAKSSFNVGNLYINRPITGAMVDRHPFGGFKLSGIGSKAGGPDYIRQFCNPKTISENVASRAHEHRNHEMALNFSN